MDNTDSSDADRCYKFKTIGNRYKFKGITCAHFAAAQDMSFCVLLASASKAVR